MKIKSFLVIALISLTSFAQQLKSPSDFLGYELGTRFTRHHQVVDYYTYLAANANKNVILKKYGTTNEHRKLQIAILSSVQNIANIDVIRAEHLKSTSGNSNAEKAIVWLSYNVHGNESVSTEASMQTAYELLTSKKEYLKNSIVIIDPCINPDGRDRYVNWYNENVNSPNNIDPNSKEHHEPWPGGRANHYLFDLNRDWAWVTQVESQQRLKVFNKWLPHVHVDFHEQGVDSPYYFAPAAEPFHEVITNWQRDFQVEIGKNHAKYFDANGWFYFTKEVFDLLYPSYGDTYPTYNGGIGMTYEQGGSGRAGLAITNRNGDILSLKDRIAHHHTTGLSTVEVAASNAIKLNQEFKKFYTDKKFKYKSYVLRGNNDHITALTELLDKHEITYGAAKSSTVKGYNFTTGKNGSLKTNEKDLVVSTNQVKGTLVKVLFEPKTMLSDSLTYDITAWSLPYAYGLNAIASEQTVAMDPYTPKTNVNKDLPSSVYAYVTDWNSMNDARFLADLFKHKIRVRFSRKPFRSSGKKFERGSLIITSADNTTYIDFKNTVRKIADIHNKTLTATNTGFVEEGKDFGSSAVKMLNIPKVAVLTGEGTSSLSFGEVWHFFEQQLKYPVSVIDTEYMGNVDFSKYDVIILPNGYYGSVLNKDRLSSLKSWVRKGGKLIAISGAINSLEADDSFTISKKKKEDEEDDEKDVTPPTSHENGERNRIKDAITGAIFKTKVDPTNPLAYGYSKSYFTLKLGSTAYDYLDNGTAVYLEDNTTPISGFAGSEAKKKIGNTLVFGTQRYGRGNVIYMVDNPLFRGFWENGKLFFANAIFMVK